MTQVTSNSVLFSYKKYANLVAPKIEEKVSTKCFYCEVRCPFYWLLPDPMSRPPGLWKSIFLQAPATEPHGRGARWTGGFPLQVNWTKEYFLTWLSCVLMIEKYSSISIYNVEYDILVLDNSRDHNRHSSRTPSGPVISFSTPVTNWKSMSASPVSWRILKRGEQKPTEGQREGVEMKNL